MATHFIFLSWDDDSTKATHILPIYLPGILPGCSKYPRNIQAPNCHDGESNRDDFGNGAIWWAPAAGPTSLLTNSQTFRIPASRAKDYIAS
jgi:hypothetical protein